MRTLTDGASVLAVGVLFVLILTLVILADHYGITSAVVGTFLAGLVTG